MYISSKFQFLVKSLSILSAGEPVSLIKTSFALLGDKFIFAGMLTNAFLFIP